MILSEASNIMYDSMPQTVPSGGWSPPSDYSSLESFDLSLLPPLSLYEAPIKEEPAEWLWEEAEGCPLELKPESGGGGPGDCRLLREVLRDTSFQRRFNLVPVSLGDLGTGYRSTATGTASMEEASAQLEPLLSLAMDQLRKEVHSTCAVLGISRDPSKWTVEEVGTWLAWNSAQYNIPTEALQFFNMPGSQLTALSEQDFQQRAPQCGNLLHAQLEIWKAASVEETTVDVSGLLQETTTQSSSSCGEPSEDEEEEEAGGESSRGGRRPGAHIHLWQFLKELLGAPHLYGSCIRWVDRSSGVFKIEDSVRVARLWGKRKNRPAMNYDKLSRSIRQYYKKGIMRKTERSQRLVYQFCHPYSL